MISFYLSAYFIFSAASCSSIEMLWLSFCYVRVASEEGGPLVLGALPSLSFGCIIVVF
jgi:hypothetical protein